MFFKNKSIKQTSPDPVSDAVREFGRIQSSTNIKSPMTFSSTVCREQHFRMPLYRYWCSSIKEQPRLHRKQWEFVYICQALYERGLLMPGRKGLGFGVGKEPLPALFASYGASILASDLDLNTAKDLGWVDTSQHSNDLSELNTLGLCEEEMFKLAVKFRNIDMNFVPKDLHDFDFCWSSCAFEHLGSISKGLDFVRASVDTLKPGGIAIHTTELNLSSNTDTLDNNPSFVIFRRRDLEALATSLEKDGHWVEPIDFYSGDDPIEQLIDMPPYIHEPHLRLELAGKYVSTSIGLIIHRGVR
jgi:SAM-dependent methyltransferase